MSSPESDDGAPPWADLPVEMVDTVVQHADLFSTTRLAAVCKSWAAAVATNTALPFGTPCLLMNSEEDDDYGVPLDDYEDWTYQLMDLTRQGGPVSFPALIWDMREQWWVGAKDDWLAVVDEYGNAQLINPYSFHQVKLPPITAGTVVKTTGQAFRRIVVCQTPSDAGYSDGYLVIGMLVNGGVLVVARDGDESWTTLRNPDGYSFIYKDAIVHKGKVFAVDILGSVYAWDMHGGACHDPEKLPRLPCIGSGELEIELDPDSWKLAETGDGRRLLLVCTYGSLVEYRRFSLVHNCDYLKFVPEGVCLFERDVDAAAGSDGDDGWSPVTSLGDHSLFLGANYPFLDRVVINQGSSDSESEWHQIRPNCICFAKDRQFSDKENYDVEVFDLGSESEIYTCSSKQLFNSNRYNTCYQTPIWFRPMLKNYDLE